MRNLFDSDIMFSDIRLHSYCKARCMPRFEPFNRRFNITSRGGHRPPACVHSTHQPRRGCHPERSRRRSRRIFALKLCTKYIFFVFCNTKILRLTDGALRAPYGFICFAYIFVVIWRGVGDAAPYKVIANITRCKIHIPFQKKQNRAYHPVLFRLSINLKQKIKNKVKTCHPVP